MASHPCVFNHFIGVKYLTILWSMTNLRFSGVSFPNHVIWPKNCTEIIAYIWKVKRSTERQGWNSKYYLMEFLIYYIIDHWHNHYPVKKKKKKLLISYKQILHDTIIRSAVFQLCAEAQLYQILIISQPKLYLSWEVSVDPIDINISKIYSCRWERAPTCWALHLYIHPSL